MIFDSKLKRRPNFSTKTKIKQILSGDYRKITTPFSSVALLLILWGQVTLVLLIHGSFYLRRYKLCRYVFITLTVLIVAFIALTLLIYVFLTIHESRIIHCGSCFLGQYLYTGSRVSCLVMIGRDCTFCIMTTVINENFVSFTTSIYI